MSENIKTYHKLKLKGDDEDCLFGRAGRSYNPIKRFGHYLYNKHKYSKFERLYDKFLLTPLQNFEEGVKNIVTWLSIIWKDRHWDDHYIFKVLKKKLELTRNTIIDNNIILNESLEEINRDITLCLNLMERVQHEYYEYKFYHEVKDKWEITITKPKTEDDFFDFIEKNLGPDDLVKYDLEIKAAFEKGRKKHEQAKRILFSILERKIEMWWD